MIFPIVSIKQMIRYYDLSSIIDFLTPMTKNVSWVSENKLEHYFPTTSDFVPDINDFNCTE